MGDNPSANSQFENIQIKLNALSQVFESFIKKGRIYFQNGKNPEGYSLLQNYPISSNLVTTIKLNTQVSGNITLNIHDILGREVRTMINEYISSGTHTVNFDANGLSSGVYFYKLAVSSSNPLETNDNNGKSFVVTKRVLMQK